MLARALTVLFQVSVSCDATIEPLIVPFDATKEAAVIFVRFWRA